MKNILYLLYLTKVENLRKNACFDSSGMPVQLLYHVSIGKFEFNSIHSRNDNFVDPQKN